jgi:two-component system chemotaxis sensor kinase CheA
MNEFLQQFLVESRELAEQASEGLLALERAPRDTGLLDAVFRALHTLKGGAGIVEFLPMERAVHAAEDVLSAARAGRLTLTPETTGACLACLDQVQQWLETLEQTGELPAQGSEQQAQRVVARFDSAVSPFGQDAPAAAREQGPAPGSLPAEARNLLQAQLDVAQQASSWAHLASAAIAASNVLRALGRNADSDQLAPLAAPENATMLAPALTQLLLRVLAEDSASLHAPGDADPSNAQPQAGSVSRTLRVDAQRIDALVRLAGEFTVAKNALVHLSRLAAATGNALAPALKSQQAALDHLVGQLQHTALDLRVLPLRVVFQRFPRLVREISATMGKQVELKIAGEETEADKAIVEMLFEPLLHLIRNALDHGVEDAALREARGKPPVATIGILASRQGNQVVIEISDDGGGMDAQRIGRTAAERGLIPVGALEGMSEAEVLELAFAPGFSTTASVTALSGRGVGMDAARAAVERIGGRVTLRSQAGLGTTVRCLLPFSVMMTKVMSVEAGGQMFGVPLDAVVETIRVPRSSLGSIGAARAIVVREQTIPVLSLGQMLGQSGAVRDTDEATIVIAGFAGQHCGLDVDALGERLEIILKPLEGLLAGTPGISGTTLLGDGRVLLVLDVAELLQ